MKRKGGLGLLESSIPSSEESSERQCQASVGVTWGKQLHLSGAASVLSRRMTAPDGPAT